MDVKKAVDISYHDGVVDFEKLKNAVDYVIIRCGYGQDKVAQDDEQWVRNVSACERLEIPYGVYFYSYAKTKANIEGEVNHCLRLLKGHNPTLPVFFDSEEKGTQYVAKYNAKRFCDAMLTNGYKAGIYASKSWFENYIGETWGYDLWIARYSNSLGMNGVDIWQYSSNGRVDGINGRCDVNHVYKDYTYKSVSNNTVNNMIGGINGMNALFKDTESGNWYWFNGDKVRLIKDGACLEILKKIHLDSTGRNMPCYEFNNTAPWDLRILQAVCSDVETYEKNSTK
jgi:GH25 family lysozyme M1 (1,4-beta-N-acetylmuramidase)